MKNLLLLSMFVFLSALIISAQNYPVKSTTENGVKVVSNPDYPKEGRYDLVLSELFTLGNEADNSKYMFSRPSEVQMDKSGNTYILDRQCKIFVFDKKGKYQKSFGKKGKGPGDFEEVAYFAITNDNKIILNDCQNMRICYLDLDGKYLDGANKDKYNRHLQLDSKNTPFADQTNINWDKVSSKMQAQTTSSAIMQFDKKAKKWMAVGEYPGERYLLMRQGGKAGMTGPFNQFIWKISPKDNIFACFEDTYEFSRYSLDGKLLSKIKRNYTYIANREYKEGSGESRYLPAITQHSYFDGDGNFWVNLDNGSKPEYYIYDVYSDDGIFQKQVYSKYRIKLFRGNIAFTMITSDLGTTLVKAFKYSFKKRN
jgi:hypothetical protein